MTGRKKIDPFAAAVIVGGEVLHSGAVEPKAWFLFAVVNVKTPTGTL